MVVNVQPHGTLARYRKGCSCSRCRAANAEYSRPYVAAYFARRKAAGKYQCSTCGETRRRLFAPSMVHLCRECHAQYRRARRTS